MPKLTQGSMNRIPLLLPPRPTQDTIAHFIKSLDDKIDLNRQTNETLEAIARALFKELLSTSDPVRAKVDGRELDRMDEATASLFPDSFEGTDIEKIPKGWSIAQIKARAADIQYGLTQSSSSEQIGPRFLRITDIQGGRVNWRHVPFCQVTPEEHVKYRICEGDIFVARTGDPAGENIYVIRPPDSVFASYLVRFRFDTQPLARFVAEYMRTPDYFEYVANVIGGWSPTKRECTSSCLRHYGISESSATGSVFSAGASARHSTGTE